jgi:uncharacterized membrane protein YphA (DoxX/SURF4 family)
MEGQQRAHFVLRLGTAFAFLYPPVMAVFDPVSWFAYFPQFIQSLPLDHTLLLHGFGFIEVIIALWILSGKNIRLPAIVASLMLLAIVVFNVSQLDVVFRDIAIAAMTLALALWPQVNAPTVQLP